MTKDTQTFNLISAVIDNNAEQVMALLDQGVNPNTPLDDANITPLHYAAQHNSLNCITLLIEAGAKLHATTRPDGQSPLEIALLHRFPQAVQLLMHYENHLCDAIN